jgi:hypothetical protein
LERLRVEWAELLAGVSACRELEALELPYIEVEPLFPPSTAFPRLTQLLILDYERDRPPDAGMMGLWELMASGWLPALAKLDVTFLGQPEGEDEELRRGRMDDVRTQVAPALEAVAGTLTHLHFNFSAHELGADAEEMGYDLGVAVVKLRRLKDLALGLSQDGRAYHAFAQGLAASGGDRPLPLLWRVGAVSRVKVNADLLASLVLPSVRVFVSVHQCFEDEEGKRAAILMTACALRQAEYKHIWTMECNCQMKDVAEAISQCSRGDVYACLRLVWFDYI